jgi:hypothetical protein
MKKYHFYIFIFLSLSIFGLWAGQAMAADCGSLSNILDKPVRCVLEEQDCNKEYPGYVSVSSLIGDCGVGKCCVPRCNLTSGAVCLTTCDASREPKGGQLDCGSGKTCCVPKPVSTEPSITCADLLGITGVDQCVPAGTSCPAGTSEYNQFPNLCGTTGAARCCMARCRDSGGVCQSACVPGESFDYGKLDCYQYSKQTCCLREDFSWLSPTPGTSAALPSLPSDKTCQNLNGFCKLFAEDKGKCLKSQGTAAYKGTGCSPVGRDSDVNFMCCLFKCTDLKGTCKETCAEFPLEVNLGKYIDCDKQCCSTQGAPKIITGSPVPGGPGSSPAKPKPKIPLAPSYGGGLTITLEGIKGFFKSGLTFSEVAGNIIKSILSVIGALALFMIVYGGIIIMSSRGGEGLKKGKDIITWAIIGVAIILSSYALVDFVIKGITNSSGGEGELTFTEFTPPTGGATPSGSPGASPSAPAPTPTTTPTPPSRPPLKDGYGCYYWQDVGVPVVPGFACTEQATINKKEYYTCCDCGTAPGTEGMTCLKRTNIPRNAVPSGHCGSTVQYECKKPPLL